MTNEQENKDTQTDAGRDCDVCENTEPATNITTGHLPNRHRGPPETVMVCDECQSFGDSMVVKCSSYLPEMVMVCDECRSSEA